MKKNIEFTMNLIKKELDAEKIIQHFSKNIPSETECGCIIAECIMGQTVKIEEYHSFKVEFGIKVPTTPEKLNETYNSMKDMLAKYMLDTLGSSCEE